MVRDDQPDAREGQAGRRGVAERFVVPLKPGNAGGGKGPQFKTDARRSEGAGGLGNLSTANSVQKLQTALHAKAKAEPGYRFYALYDKISREDILAHASGSGRIPTVPAASPAPVGRLLRCAIACSAWPPRRATRQERARQQGPTPIVSQCFEHRRQPLGCAGRRESNKPTYPGEDGISASHVQAAFRCSPAATSLIADMTTSVAV